MNNKFAIGIIGAGKIGAILGAAYRACGHEITGVYTANPENIERCEILLPKVPVCSMQEIIEKSEIVFFTIPDDELEPTITGLAKLDVFKQGQILVHTSGRCGLGVFEASTKTIGMSLHPIMTFTGTSLDLPKLKNTTFAINAPKLMLPIAQALVMELEANPIIVEDTVRDLYHLGLSHAANHMSLVINQSIQILEHAGIEDPQVILKPLLEAALERTLMQRVKGISGPVPRGDAQTIQKHIEALKINGLEELVDTYIMLTKNTVKECLESKVITENTANKIMKTLEK